MPTVIQSRSGLRRTLDLSAVPNGTELNGLLGWTVYESGGPGNGYLWVQSAEIVSRATLPYGMALWVDDTVKGLGHCIRAEVTSPDWSTIVLGLVANGTANHLGSDTRGLLYDSFELRQRSGADYGAGFSIAGGVTPGNPLANNSYYELLLASVQQPDETYPRGGMVYNNVVLAFTDAAAGLSTGVNDGTLTYPGLIWWQAAGAHWRNIRVYYDYRLTVRGLSGTQTFRLYDAFDAVLESSGLQSGGEAHVNLHGRTWPITGYIKIFTDNTYTEEVVGGRMPSAGTVNDLVGGDVYDLTTAGAGIQWNYDNNPVFPGEWFDPTSKDVTRDCVYYDVLQVAGNPNIEVDTLEIVLRDPTGKYVPARTASPLYPNLRLGRPIRLVFEEEAGTACRFYGKVASIKPVPFDKDSDEPEQRVRIRAESPMREIANSEITLNFAFQGPLVNADGSGVIASLLDLVAHIIPLDSRELQPTPDVIPEGFLSVGMTVQTALEQCAIYSYCMYGVLPHLKESADEPNFYFVWTAVGALAGAVADHTWVDTNGDIHELEPDYTGDVL